MNEEKRALVEKFWTAKQRAERAQTRRWHALHLVIGDRAREEDLLAKALAATDEQTEALKECDLIAHEINEAFPPVAAYLGPFRRGAKPAEEKTPAEPAEEG